MSCWYLVNNLIWPKYFTNMDSFWNKGISLSKGYILEEIVVRSRANLTRCMVYLPNTPENQRRFILNHPKWKSRIMVFSHSHHSFTPLKTKMTGWKIPMFNRKYIDSFIHGGFSIAMLVFRGVFRVFEPPPPTRHTCICTCSGWVNFTSEKGLEDGLPMDVSGALNLWGSYPHWRIYFRPFIGGWVPSGWFSG